MLEKLATVIAASIRGGEENGSNFVGEWGFKDGTVRIDAYDVDLRAVARAVIEALMEPSPEMIASAELGYVTSMMDVEHNNAIVKGVFVSMLQSILQSKEEGDGR